MKDLNPLDSSIRESRICALLLNVASFPSIKKFETAAKKQMNWVLSNTPMGSIGLQSPKESGSQRS